MPKKNIATIYFLSFVWSVAIALPTFIQSSFIEELFGLRVVGLLIMLSTALTLLAMLGYADFIKRYTHNRVVMLVLAADVFSLIGLISMREKWAAAIFFVIQFICMHLLVLSMDIFLENQSDNEHTGQIRGLLLTTISMAGLFSPIIAGHVVQYFPYTMVYFISAMILIPTFFILIINRKLLSITVSYRRQRLRQWLGSFRIQQPDLVNIFWLNLMLSVFFSVMIFYAPIYLNQHIGFDWAEIGVLFTIMLIPFVLFQAPAGAIADKFLGEKEIALTGLFLMIASVMAIPSLGTKNFVAWAVILFTGRSGVALLRSMIDSYFFKKIDIVDIDIINAFRALTPLGYLIGSAGVTLILFFLPFKFIFVALAIVLFFGIRPALKLHDTK